MTPLADGGSPAELAQRLAGNGVEVREAGYSGDRAAAGTFSAAAGAVGIDQGVILSTGKVVDVAGPNDSDATDGVLAQPGDDDLEKLIGGTLTYDASVLEFDFVPAGEEVVFRYVFASEEYHEFANVGFNDVFGFFVNGLNVALLPDGKTVVSVDTVNGGNPGLPADVPKNPAFFVSNSPCYVVGDPPCPFDVEADGLTVVLTTIRAPVAAGKPNHIKLAIADVGDPRLDSWVFVAAESLVVAEVCTNEKDDDADDLIDKADPDCWICGDGVVDPNEECDDRGIVDGDGCSALCRTEPGATTTTTMATTSTSPTSTTTTTTTTTTVPRDACTTDAGLPLDCDDGDVCTADSCDPAAGCVHDTAPADGATCDDGDPCTAGDACGAGTCRGERTCGPDIPPGSDQPVRDGAVAIPCTGAVGETCTVELFLDEPAAATLAAGRTITRVSPLGSTTRISKRVKPKKIKRRGRVVLRISLARQGRVALKASGGRLPVVAQATVGARGQPPRVTQVPFSLLALRRRGGG